MASSKSNSSDLNTLHNLFERFQSPDAEVRCQAVMSVKEVRHPLVLAHLAIASHDEDVVVRKLATVALDIPDIEVQAQTLVFSLESPDHAVRSLAAKGLCALRRIDIYPAIMRGMQSDNPFTLTTCLEAARNFRRTKARSHALRLLAHGDAEVRVQSALLLCGLREAALLDTLVSVVMTDPSAQVRLSTLNALRFCEDSRVLQLLIYALKDTHWAVRSTAAAGLGRNKCHAAIGRLIDATHDPVWQVQQSAVVALGSLHAVDALEAINRCMRSDHVDLRRSALVALGEIAHRNCLPLIQEALGDVDPSVRKAAKLAAKKVVRV